MEFAAFVLLVLIVLTCTAGVNDLFNTVGYRIAGAEMATYLADSDIHLFVNNVTITPNTAIGDLTEASFPGYAVQNLVTVPIAYPDPVNGGYSSFIPSHVFRANAAVPSPETVYGWYMTDTGGNLIAAGNLPEPILVDADNDTVPLQITLNYPG